MLYAIAMGQIITYTPYVAHKGPGQIFRIGTVRYAEGLWRMRRYGPFIAHCTDSEDFPGPDVLTLLIDHSKINPNFNSDPNPNKSNQIKSNLLLLTY